MSKYKITVVWKGLFNTTTFYALKYLIDGKLLKIVSPIEGQIDIVLLDNAAYIEVNAII